jgi:hypothetical protein
MPLSIVRYSTAVGDVGHSILPSHLLRFWEDKPEILRTRHVSKKIPPLKRKRPTGGVIRTKRKSFEQHTVQGDTGVSAQDRGGGGTVGSTQNAVLNYLTLACHS